MGATCHACIGGTNVRNEVQKLQAEAPHIVVGTPGRVYDMLNRKFLCEYSVLCEIQCWGRIHEKSSNTNLFSYFTVKLRLFCIAKNIFYFFLIPEKKLPKKKKAL